MGEARAAVTEESVHNWFKRTEKILQDEKVDHILLEKSRIFNWDETGTWLNPMSGKVLGEKGKPAYCVSPNDEKLNLTVLFTISADGKFVAPFVLHKGKQTPKEWKSGGSLPDNWKCCCTMKGWMTCPSFIVFAVQPACRERTSKLVKM